jgi:hypothetical protein
VESVPSTCLSREGTIKIVKNGWGVKRDALPNKRDWPNYKISCMIQSIGFGDQFAVAIADGQACRHFGLKDVVRVG